MSNLCRNIIKITGAGSHLDVLKSKLNEPKDESINFMEYLIGLPNIPDNYYTEGWYDYNCKRFGTKRDIPFSQLDLKIEEDLISIVAGSAGSPIIPFLSKLCKKYKVNAIIDFYEPGCDFGGRAQIDSFGRDFVHQCSYMEAIFLYDHGAFWEELDHMIEDEEFTDLEELMEQFDFLPEEDHVKIGVLWNEKNNS